jgi:hypothetical protein
MTTETRNRGWDLARQVKNVGPRAKDRRERESLLTAGCRRGIDVVVVGRPDGLGRSLPGRWCKRHMADPFANLKRILQRVQTHPTARFAELLPDA